MDFSQIRVILTKNMLISQKPGNVGEHFVRRAALKISMGGASPLQGTSSYLTLCSNLAFAGSPVFSFS